MTADTSKYLHITVNNYDYAYQKIETSPENPQLILVHGHISDLRTWSAVISLLSKHFTIYNYSRRFAWPNVPIADQQNQSWEQDGQDLIDIIQALDIAPCHALGNSSGAYSILLATRTHAHLFKTIMLEEPPVIPLFYPTLPPGPLAMVKFLVTHPISFWPVTYYGATTIGPAIACAQANLDSPEKTLNIFGPGVLGSKFWQRANADPARKQQLMDNAKWLHNFCAYGALPQYTAEDAARVSVPSLVLTGTEGPWVARCIDAELVRLMRKEGTNKRVERAWVQGAGHLMHEDEPQEVARLVRRFVFGGAEE